MPVFFSCWHLPVPLTGHSFYLKKINGGNQPNSMAKQAWQYCLISKLLCSGDSFFPIAIPLRQLIAIQGNQLFTETPLKKKILKQNGHLSWSDLYHRWVSPKLSDFIRWEIVSLNLCPTSNLALPSSCTVIIPSNASFETFCLSLRGMLMRAGKLRDLFSSVWRKRENNFE